MERFNYKVNPENYQKQYSAVVVLGAVMEWRQDSDRWLFTVAPKKYGRHHDYQALEFSINTINPQSKQNPYKYRGGLVMGFYRAHAAAAFYKRAESDHGEGPLLLVTGGSDEHPTHPDLYISRASELARRIVKLGVPAEKVRQTGEFDGSNTNANIENVIEFLEASPEIEASGPIAFLGPTFQMERANLMHRSKPHFASTESNILLVEDILSTKHANVPGIFDEVDMKKLFKAIYNSPAGFRCYVSELQGMRDFHRGSYKPMLTKETAGPQGG